MKTIDEAINYAAKELPEGCILNIKIEKHGYDVELDVPADDYTLHTISISEGDIIDDILVGVDRAKEYLAEVEEDE